MSCWHAAAEGRVEHLGTTVIWLCARVVFSLMVAIVAYLGIMMLSPSAFCSPAGDPTSSTLSRATCRLRLKTLILGLSTPRACRNLINSTESYIMPSTVLRSTFSVIKVIQRRKFPQLQIALNERIWRRCSLKILSPLPGNIAVDGVACFLYNEDIVSSSRASKLRVHGRSDQENIVPDYLSQKLI